MNRDSAERGGAARAEELSGYRRVRDRSVRRLAAPIATDVLGTAVLYHAAVGGAVFTSGSVGALARHLGAVTLDPLALAETLAFGFPLRDRTAFAEIRAIPAHATLHPDGRIEARPGPRATATLTDAAAAAARVRDALERILAAEEPRYQVHCAGLTGGRDSRILAALGKREPDRWHWLSVTGEGDAEHEGSMATAARLGLPHHAWLEWTADYLDGLIGESADLAGGLGAVSDASLLSGRFAGYRRDVLGRGADDVDVVLWLGTLGDELLAGTWLPPHVPAATTIWDAVTPRADRLPRILAPHVVERFADEGAYYRSNPFELEATSAEDTGWLIRQLTRGRGYLCRMEQTFDRVCAAQLNPYMHADVVDVVLALHPRLRASDEVRTELLRGLGPDLDAPSAYGFKAPAYAEHVLTAVTAEAARCAALDGVLEPGLLDGLRRGELRDLATADDAGKPAYRVHADTSPLVRSLRDYEHLLMYAAFVGQLERDGVVIGAAR
jgi:asparagine synthetase B (glutamine-hydrolysing)